MQHIVVAIALAAGFGVVAIPLTATPAIAEVCRDGQTPVKGPRGKIICKDKRKDPGKSPDPGRQPREGQRWNQERLEPGCGHAGTCIHETCDFEAGEQMMSVYTRTVIYHRGQGWRPAPPPDGEWQVTGSRCVKPGEQAPSAEQVWEAVKEFEIPGGTAEIQPPNGRSLVNFKTNFYTTKGDEKFDLPVGPVTVQIKATPQTYEWDFDDGPTRTTDTPGRKYPHLDIVHVYKQPGEYKPSVTIQYLIEWKYGRGDWQAFDDTLPAATSPTTDLQIMESQSELGD